MSQAEQYLRDIFMTDGDGIEKAKGVIIGCGGEIDADNNIYVTTAVRLLDNKRFQNAVDFLVEEWDFAYASEIRLSPADKEVYLADPHRCPLCREGPKSSVTQIIGPTGSFTVRRSCIHCRATWTERYRLVDISEIGAS